MTSILAIDPGTSQSGLVWMIGNEVIRSGVFRNQDVHAFILEAKALNHRVVIEMMSSYGMAVGQETFETLVWIGRFLNCAQDCGYRLYRRDVRLHLCGSLRAKDSNVWQAILDRYGGSAAKGTKKQPGPLYGIRSYCRAALALGLTWLDGIRSDV